MATTPEGRIKSKTKELLKSSGVFWYMPVNTSGIGRVGIPDILACIPLEITKEMVGKKIGVFAGIETKAPGKLLNTTPNQRKELQAISDANGMAVVLEDPSLLAGYLDRLRRTGKVETFIPERTNG